MNALTPEKLLVKIASILEKLRLKYFITGGVAISVWGRPRATFDIDIVIVLIQAEIPFLAKELKKISPIGYFDEEMARDAILNKGEFNFIDSETGLKIDFWLAKNDEISLSEFKRRRLKIINGQKIYFISPEDLILSKLEWYKQGGSTRQLEDIESILKISGENLDMPYLDQWAKKLSVSEILTKLLGK